MLPSETMIWQPEFTDKTLSRKPGAVQYRSPCFERWPGAANFYFCFCIRKNTSARIIILLPEAIQHPQIFRTL
ncbi:hypothetical protein F6B19_24010 [Escherichia coli]|nr:hypothetical protein [Escherichia coli]